MSNAVTEINVASDPKVAELVALAAAVGSNCEACFRSHYDTARSVGLSTEEIVSALNVAEAVKATPARRMRELAARKLDVSIDAFSSETPTPVANAGDVADAEAAACCGPSVAAAPAPDDTLCC
jgi:AhpD family alkylhydroperoxidase